MIYQYGEKSYGEADPSYATADPFRLLLQNPEAQLKYLVELYPYSQDVTNTLLGSTPYGVSAYGEYDMIFIGGLDPVYLSDKGFISEPTDSIVSKIFHAQVDNPLQINSSIISGDNFGGSSVSYGSLVINNQDGELDHLNEYFWAARRVVVKAGAQGFSYDDYAIVFDGAANSIEWDDDRITVTIQDNRVKTDQLIIPAIYLGTGSLEGGTDLINKPKPLCFGVVRNVEPVLVDPVNLIYQVHDKAIQSIDGVRDSGIDLTSEGDVADITVAVVSAGFYKTQLSGGYIKLGSTPEGRITVDAHGESQGGFVSKPGDIIERIITTRLGLNNFESSYVDSGSLNDLDTDLPLDMGLYLTDRATASAAIDELLLQTASYWSFSRQGQLFAGVVNDDGIEIMTIDSDVVDEQGVKIKSTIPPAWRISVGYARVWTVQDQDELAAGAAAADKAYYSEEYRYVTYENNSIRSQNQQSVELVFLTNIATQSEAEDLLDRLSEIYTVKRRVYEVSIYRCLFSLYIGNTVKLEYPRFGLDAGVNLLIVGIGEDAETGQTTLELWG
jgi:hypothetical protein